MILKRNLTTNTAQISSTNTYDFDQILSLVNFFVVAKNLKSVPRILSGYNFLRTAYKRYKEPTMENIKTRSTYATSFSPLTVFWQRN